MIDPSEQPKGDPVPRRRPSGSAVRRSAESNGRRTKPAVDRHADETGIAAEPSLFDSLMTPNAASGPSALARRLAALPIAPPARRDGQTTSRLAAESMRVEAAAQRLRVLECIVDGGAEGRTDSEVEDLLNIRAQSVSPRRGELVKSGLVEDSGIRRPTSSGRLAIVWRATPLAVGKAGPG